MKKLTFFITLMMLLGVAATAYAGAVPASYNFENYIGDIPSGWEGNNGTYIKKAEVDEEHGTSLALYNKGADAKPELRYALPTVSEGRFLISFEINSKDVNKNMRITLESPSSGSMWHSIFYMNTSKEICAWMNTVSGAWNPQKMLSFELDKWYKADILLDMDNKVMKYYIDGVYYTSSTISFDDFSRIFFRVENGVEGTEGYTYLDNVSFKYLTADGMEVFLKNNSVNAGEDEIEIGFSDLIATSTLNKLNAYSMGSNPIEYTKDAVGCSIVSQDNQKATIRFNESLQENTIYKIEIPGLTSVYGYEYVNNSVYFTTNKSKADKKVVNSDFSAEETGAIAEPWIASSPYVRIAALDETDEEGNSINAVRFSRRSSEMSLRRDLETAFEDRVVFEYKMKSETPNQIFRVYDLQGQYIDFVTVTSDGIYYGENKLSDYTSDWFVVSMELNQPESKVVFYIDGEEIGEYDYDGIAEAAAVEFIQRNSDGASGNDRAKTDIAYFTATAQMPSVGINFITFEGSDGKTYYPDDDIPAKISKIAIDFSDSVKAYSLEGGVSLTTDGDYESFIGDYDAINKRYVMELPQYLEGDSEYIIELNGVIDGMGADIDSVSGVFATQPGVYECDNLGIELLGQNLNISAEITHTNACYDDIYIVYAAYKGDYMVDFAAERIVPNDGERKIEVQKSYASPSDADTVRAFLWDGFDTRHPLTEVKIVTFE